MLSVVAAGGCGGPLQSSTVPLSLAGLEPTCPGTQERVREVLIDDRLYSAILRSLEQTHCARMWFYVSD